MPRKKRETLVHFDIDTLAKHAERKEAAAPASLGQTLRTKREKKKLSIEDVSRKLCIKEVYLTALEEGHYYAFPNRVYGIGFLRTYSKFLGLDSDLMVAEFHAETSNIKDAPLDMPVIEKHFALPSKKILGVLALIILLILIVWFAIAAALSTDLFSKLTSSEQLTNTPAIEIETLEEVPTIADETLSQEEQEAAIETSETKIAEPVVVIKEISPAALKAPVAFIAKNDVWVRLYNTETQKVILDKVLKKNDSFIPESRLSVLEITTGRENLLDLYKNGTKVKTFGHEKSHSLVEFAED